ncbi:VOC family protein [Asticcacaulis biprosthecium]|uniref:VOC family protein n=1 Tax=Asticcacaulis biprosthecium TaxID=76891 RepID=UPI0012F4D483|nr:VOC family protein [Asticcacaulis biprosthecium]
MELDHVFIFCGPEDGLEERLKAAGFVETYRRCHPGQGTENICFCFDNAFIELLWVSDEAEVRSSAIARTGLFERSRYIDLGTCPFGIAWRGNSNISTWPYRPPYLPKPMAIDVATDGDAAQQPMMFRSPGDSPPISWPDERRGNLQRQAGFQSVRIREFVMPANTPPSTALQLLAKNLGFAISNSERGYRIDLEIVRLHGQMPVVISLL